MATKNSLAKFRLESDLWSEFKAKCETTGKPYSQVLREFCLTYVSVPQGLEMFTEVEESGQMGLRLDGNNSTDTNLDVVVHSVGELYSGPGGIGLGAARASVVHNGCRWITEPKWVNDYDLIAVKLGRIMFLNTTAKSHGSADIHVGDVRNLNIEELAQLMVLCSVSAMTSVLSESRKDLMSRSVGLTVSKCYRKVNNLSGL